MSNIIKLMKKMGLSADEGGVCHGLAMMAIHAYLLGIKEYDGFLLRLARIVNGNLLIEDEEKPDWDTRAFLEGVALFFLPSKYSFLFPLGKVPRQSDIEETAAVAQSQLAEEQGGIKKIGSFTGLYQRDEINRYLESLWNAITSSKEKPRYALLLNTYNHTIMLAYDASCGWWSFQNHDCVYYFKSEAIQKVSGMIKRIFTSSFNSAEPLILSTTVLSLGKAETLEASNEVYALWRGSESWKAIHVIDEFKAKTNCKLRTWLYMAAREGHVDVVKKLLGQKDIDVNVILNGGDSTPLHIATQEGHLGVVKELLEHNNIDINVHAKNGFTSLFIATQKSHLDIVKEMLKHNDIDVNACNKEGDTALHIAAHQGHLDVVKELLKHNDIDVNACNKEGDAALHIAAHQGHLDVVKELLKHSDIDVYVRNKKGFTPLYMAQKIHRDVAKELFGKMKEEASRKVQNKSDPLENNQQSFFRNETKEKPTKLADIPKSPMRCYRS